MNFICDDTSGALRFDNCTAGKVSNTCDMSVTSTKGWSHRESYHNCRQFQNDMDVSVASGATAGLGGLITISNSFMTGTRSITKAGTQFGNIGVSVINQSFYSGNWDIDNFNTGLAFGLNHYNAETGGMGVMNAPTISNCTIGLRLWGGSFVRKYSVTYTSNTTDEDIQSGSFTS
jgi:hypothetical protein